MRRTRLLLVMIIVSLFILPLTLQAADRKVYIVPIEGTVNKGLAALIEDSFLMAEKNQATMVVLEIDTPGGLVDAAVDIRDTILRSTIPSAAIVKGGAISAGALITLACDQIVMFPGSTLGAAEPRIGSEKADSKYISYFTKEMASTAAATGRRVDLAEAMVDSDISIPGIIDEGKLLTLTYQEAKLYGYADHIANNRTEAIKSLGVEPAVIEEIIPSFGSKILMFITNPYVAPFLLMLGVAGVVIEFFTVGWGVAGSIGLLCLGLYFGGNLLAGVTGWGAVLLFLLGIILLAVEAFVPGFGIPGISGTACMAASIILAAPSIEAGIVSLILAIVGSIILLLISFKILQRRKIWSKLILETRYRKEDGYIPQPKDLEKFIGQTGKAYTTLRPAGTAVLEDGTRLDVVTEGEFISKNSEIEIISVEGVRIVVRELEKDKI